MLAKKAAYVKVTTSSTMDKNIAQRQRGSPAQRSEGMLWAGLAGVQTTPC